MKRRQLIKSIALATGAITVSSDLVAEVINKVQAQKKRRVLRIAHITDVHIRPEHDAPNRFRKCLEEIKKQKIDFFLNGGDSVYAADHSDITRERVNEQWEIWRHCRDQFKEYELYNCLGNHDMWWAAPDKQDTMYGKDYAAKQLGIPGRYYSFDKKGWHFVILDSNNKDAGSLDEEQRKWLENDLGKLPSGTPVLCLSHYPILAACSIMTGGNHTDSKYITELFYKHSDKKISCLSGHLHLQDIAAYNGVQFYCNGAISGYWWEDGDKESAGKYYHKQTPPGYAIVDLFEDGTVHNQYIPHSF